MDKQKIFAVVYRRIGFAYMELSRTEIGVAVLDESRVTAHKYNELKRAAMKAYPTIPANCVMCIYTEDGRFCSTRPAPAPYVRFAK